MPMFLGQRPAQCMKFLQVNYEHGLLHLQYPGTHTCCMSMSFKVKLPCRGCQLVVPCGMLDIYRPQLVYSTIWIKV